MVDKCLPRVKSVWPNTKRTALHIVARHGHSQCISILVESGANTESLDKDGKTPLALAAWQNDCESIQELLKAGARVEKVGARHLKNIDLCEERRVHHMNHQIEHVRNKETSKKNTPKKEISKISEGRKGHQMKHQITNIRKEKYTMHLI